jgi:hypothetical protein
VSPPPNWSREGRATKDLSIGQIRAPQSASEVHRRKAWQPVPGIGHPLLLRFSPRRGALIRPPLAYGSCRSYGKRGFRVSHSSLDGRPAGAAHRLHRPGDERQRTTGRGDQRPEQMRILSNER